MITYCELEKLRNTYEGEVCVFGGGFVGKCLAYDFLKIFDFRIDFYCDNYLKPGTIVREGRIIKDVQYLYEHKENVLVFICATYNAKEAILQQMKENQILNVWVLDLYVMAQIMDSIDKADNWVKQRYNMLYEDKKYLLRTFETVHGYQMNLEKPCTFNEKLLWLKLYNRNPRYTQLVDKIALKKYVAKRFGEQYIIPTLGVWENFESIDFDKLPDKFVLKCTHDSGSIVLVDDKKKLDYKKMKKRFDVMLNANYYWVAREWPYKNVIPKIFSEEYVSNNANEELMDYKCFVFSGEVKLILVDIGKFTNHRRNIYDKDWNLIQICIKHPRDIGCEISRPKCLNKMIEVAEALSTEIPYVRVDFYVVNDQPLVGEMTFFHDGGMSKLEPREWEEILGDWIKLPVGEKEHE